MNIINTSAPQCCHLCKQTRPPWSWISLVPGATPLVPICQECSGSYAQALDPLAAAERAVIEATLAYAYASYTSHWNEMMRCAHELLRLRAARKETGS